MLRSHSLMPSQIRNRLLRNWDKRVKAEEKDEKFDPQPVVKFFTPFAQATWLITEMDPEDGDLLFGLCDLGMGEPELGYVRLSELEELKEDDLPLVERDLHFKADKSLGEYTEIARTNRQIIT